MKGTPSSSGASIGAAWVAAVLVAGAATLALAWLSIVGLERLMAAMFVGLEVAGVLFWMRETRDLEEREALRIGSAVGIEAREDARDRATVLIEGSQATGANALVAFGMAASAAFLLYHARNFKDDLDSVLAVAPKAFTATGFAITCALLVMLRAHFGWRRVIQQSREGDRSMVTLSGEQQRLVEALDRMSHALESEQVTRGEFTRELKESARSMAGVVVAAREHIVAVQEQVSKKNVDRIVSAVANMADQTAVIAKAFDGFEKTLTSERAAVEASVRSDLLASVKAESQQVFGLLSGEVQRVMQEVRESTGKLSAKVEGEVAGLLGNVAQAGHTIERQAGEISGKLQTNAEQALVKITERVVRLPDEFMAEISREGSMAKARVEQVSVDLAEMNRQIEVIGQGLKQTLEVLASLELGKTDGAAPAANPLAQVETLCASLDKLTRLLVGSKEEQRKREQRLQALRNDIEQLLREG